MKNVTAKINAAGATVFYADGKRVSRAQLSEWYASELYMDKLARRKIPQRGEFVIEMWGARQVPCENGDSATVKVDFRFFLNADTVSDALKDALAAVKSPDVHQAMIYDVEEYNRNYHVWGYPQAIGVRADKVWATNTYGHVYQSYLDELAAQNFQPVIDCNAAREKSEALAAKRKELRQLERAAWREETDAQNARDAAVEAHLQRLIA